MKDNRNERVVKGYYSNIILNVIFFVVFVVVILNVIIPGYNTYKTNKEMLLIKVEDYKKLEKDGLNFSDFVSLVTDNKTKKLISKIGADFFDNNLKNTTSKSYIDFLKDKEKRINELKKSNIVKQRDEKISRILPSYQQGASIEGNMTDLEFVNYIEVMLRSFRLKTNSEIGISDVVLVSDKSEKDSNRTSLSSQIFYIPVKLDIEGAKGDIVEFLHFLQNVGKIESVKDNDVIVYRDNVLNKSFGQTYNWNIYENKIVDIEFVEFKDYIDTSSFIRTTSSERTTMGFLNFIRNGVERGQEFKISIGLRFYVKGLPTYKLEDFILKTIDVHKQKLKLVNDSLNSIQTRKQANTITEMINISSNLKSIQTYLTDMDQTVKRLESGVKNINNLEVLYADAAKLKYDVDNISHILDENIKKLKSLQSKK